MNNRWRQIKRLPIPVSKFFDLYYNEQPDPPCPVCGGKVLHRHYYDEHVGIAETVDECTECNYYETESYGDTRLEVGKWSAVYHYTTSDKEISQIRGEFVRQQILEKERRKTERRKYYRKRG
ncbi:hypothetical protein [Paenibacillus polymyxa]|uniref:Uncharacterized protein n=1 Tax=Paenibacillus polymyxa (strain SC2) TaxID=886882 RepID=E3EKL8_PAEPS|nr:hypothetical protein [Paenibacillus polymyxa]ADO59850.1 hypothetical protein PPSC2_25940 [Paenibacillus polymyxa SC2]WPQ59920.1 hypothetical protein SKN87_27140 [Paenibacillus polymyxa]